MPLNWLEVTIESKPATPIEVMVRDDQKEDALCPSSHPYAFNQGKECCESKILLRFDSTKCLSKSTTCPSADQRCLNHNYENYGCYMENVDLSTTSNLGYIYTDTAFACEQHAKKVSGASGFIWTSDWPNNPKACFPKANAKVTPGPKGLKSWAALFSCI